MFSWIKKKNIYKLHSFTNKGYSVSPSPKKNKRESEVDNNYVMRYSEKFGKYIIVAKGVIEKREVDFKDVWENTSIFTAKRETREIMVNNS